MSYLTGTLIQRTPVFRLESVSSGSDFSAVDICHQMEYSTPTPPHPTYLRLSSQACRTGVSKTIQDINNPFCTASQEREIESVWWEHEVRCKNHYDSGGDSIVLGIVPFPPLLPPTPPPPPPPTHTQTPLGISVHASNSPESVPSL